MPIRCWAACKRGVDVAALSHLLAETAPVREPVAAGASRFNEEIDKSHDQGDKLVRRTLLVVDSGAGTTFFSLFQVFQKGDDIRYALISPSIRMCALAGNAVDEILTSVVLEACGINPENGYPRNREDFTLAMANLRAEIREINRDLFEYGSRRVALRPMCRVQCISGKSRRTTNIGKSNANCWMFANNGWLYFSGKNNFREICHIQSMYY